MRRQGPPKKTDPLRCQGAPPPGLCPGHPSKCQQPLRPAASSNPLWSSARWTGPWPDRQRSSQALTPPPAWAPRELCRSRWRRKGEKPLHSQELRGCELRGPLSRSFQLGTLRGCRLVDVHSLFTSGSAAGAWGGEGPRSPGRGKAGSLGGQEGSLSQGLGLALTSLSRSCHIWLPGSPPVNWQD